MICVPTGLLLALLTAAPPAKDEKRTTVTYDIADLVRNAPAWRGTGFGLVRARQDTGVAEALVDIVQRSVDPTGWRPGKEGGNSLRLFNGTKLVVHTTAKQHAEIKQLLEALHRFSDISVMFDCELYEVDRAFHKKHVEPLFAGEKDADRRLALPVGDEVQGLLKKQTKPLQWSKRSFLVGREADVFALRTGFTYQAKPKGGPRADTYRTAFHGVTFRARVGVSPDRRFVRLHLTQKATELVGIRQERVFDPLAEKRMTVEVPNLVTTTATAGVEVGDGALLLLPVKYRPPGAKNKDKVWVLFLHLRIVIAEEERALRNNSK